MQIIAEKQYQNKEWLNDQYWNKRKSQTQIAKVCNIHQTTIQNWMKRLGIQARNTSESCSGVLNGMYGKHHSKKTKKKISELAKKLYKNEKNPAWKGDKAGYNALHNWMRKHKKKPSYCGKCGKATNKLELSNNGILNRDPINYEYLCCRCHKIKDGTISNIRNQEGIYN